MSRANRGVIENFVAPSLCHIRIVEGCGVCASVSGRSLRGALRTCRGESLILPSPPRTPVGTTHRIKTVCDAPAGLCEWRFVACGELAAVPKVRSSDGERSAEVSSYIESSVFEV